MYGLVVGHLLAHMTTLEDDVNLLLANCYTFIIHLEDCGLAGGGLLLCAAEKLKQPLETAI